MSKLTELERLAQWGYVVVKASDVIRAFDLGPNFTDARGRLITDARAVIRNVPHSSGMCGDVCGMCEFHPEGMCGGDCGGCCNEAEVRS